MELKNIQSSISVIAGIACIIIGVMGISKEQAVPFQYVFGIVLCFIGMYAIAHGMTGLGFKIKPHFGMKFPL